MGYRNKQLFTSILLGILFSILFASTDDAKSDEEKNIASIPFIQPASAQQSSPSPEPTPKPILSFTATEEKESGGNQLISYSLTVVNWQSYPQYLFDNAPHLPPCGSNQNAARTWVNIFNGQTDVRIYGFCAFSSPNDLTKLWFAVSATSTPPPSVYVKLIDRQEAVTYISNIVTIPGPEPDPGPSYIERIPYPGDCDARPSGTVCIAYSDGYIWLVSDSVQGWDDIQEDGKNVQVAIGNNTRYYHILNPNLVGFGPQEAERYPDPSYFELEPSSKDCSERRLGGIVCIGYSDGHVWLVSDSIQGWDDMQKDGKNVEVAVGFKARYYHILNPNLVKTGPLLTQADPEPVPEPAAPTITQIPSPTNTFPESIAGTGVDVGTTVFVDIVTATGTPVAFGETVVTHSGGAWTVTSLSFVSPFSVTNTPDDDYVIITVAIDADFNQSLEGTDVTFTLDQTEPVAEPAVPAEPATPVELAHPEPKPRPSFVDPEKDPQSYVDRYNNEAGYKKWFDKNYPDYTIYEAVGLPESVKEKVPGWIKNNAKWWSEGQIDDNTFVQGIQFMIKEKIINIPNLPEQASETAEEKVPDWIRNNAGWWADGLISEDDFVNGIKYLVEKGIIKI